MGRRIESVLSAIRAASRRGWCSSRHNTVASKSGRDLPREGGRTESPPDIRPKRAKALRSLIHLIVPIPDADASDPASHELRGDLAMILRLGSTSEGGAERSVAG